MTKYDWREYQTLKAEIDELTVLVRKIDRLGYESDDLADTYAKRKRALSERLRAMEEALQVLDPIERRLMRMRYIDGLAWTAIETRLHYSHAQVHRIHGIALTKLRDL